MLKLIVKNSYCTKCMLITEIELNTLSGDRKEIAVFTASGHRIRFHCSSNEKTIALFDELVEKEVCITDDYHQTDYKTI